MALMRGYGEDLAAVHAAGFTTVAVAAARELLGRLPGPARVVELGAGFAAGTLPRGYAGEPLPRGWTAYTARKR
jgi:hypothetical protein